MSKANFKLQKRDKKKDMPMASAISYPIVTDDKKGKLIISPELEEQIDIFHAIAGSTEWSGILLYVIKEGDISKPESLVIEVKGMFPMDIGTPGYTEYDYDERTLDMYDLYPNALEEGWRLGHIHTHHNMKAYFSGTDLQELRDNIDNHAYYLSLIVNFDKKYCAKICIKGEREVKESSVLKYTGLFDNKKSNKKSNSTKIETIVYNADLDIEMPEKNTDISFIGEILKLKKKKKSYTSSWSTNNNHARYENGWGHSNKYDPERENFSHGKTNGTQVSIWDDTDSISDVEDIESFIGRLITVDIAFERPSTQSFKEFISAYNKRYLNMTNVDKDLYERYMADNIGKVVKNLNFKNGYEINLLEDTVNFLDDYGYDTKAYHALTALASDIILEYLDENWSN